jgi:DNA end-binding protein Ku
MTPRSVWKGFLKLSLVSVPIKAYTASNTTQDVHLHQLHDDCHSRIHYQKVCPRHGEVPNDQIVSGYEYAKGQYVVVSAADIDRLRGDADKAIQIDVFIPPSAFDPLYATGKRYYLAPDGPVGQQGYAVLYQAMVEEKRYALAQAVLHGREQWVLLRPQEGLLVLEVLHYAHQVHLPETFRSEAPLVEVAPQELLLAKTLIGAASAKAVDWGRYPDRYTQKLTQVIEAKVAGQEIVAPPVGAIPEVINLMEALKKSVARVQQSTKKDAAKPARKAGGSRRAAPARQIS